MLMGAQYVKMFFCEISNIKWEGVRELEKSRVLDVNKVKLLLV